MEKRFHRLAGAIGLESPQTEPPKRKTRAGTADSGSAAKILELYYFNDENQVPTSFRA
jgi:hypothetical protein